MAIFAAGLISVTGAWESDSHYGLTCWLAIKAGFSARDAELIAAADLRLDQGAFGPATWDSIFVIAGDKPTSENASRNIRGEHFPTEGPVPGHPELRGVKPNNDYARQAVDHAINAALTNRDDLLKELGSGLHPFQDSWAHQGIPDTPFSPLWAPKRDLTWGHPKARGGWALHDADLTYRDVPGTMDMALRTYEFLRKFLDKHSKEYRVRNSVAWETLEPQVRVFALGETKEEKLIWFRSDPDIPISTYTNEDFLEETALPGKWSEVRYELGSESPVARFQPVAYRLKVPRYLPPSPITTTPDVFKNTVDAFLTTWLQAHDIDESMTYINPTEIAHELHRLHATDIDSVKWARKFLTMWLIEDHGLVNQKGHGLPLADGYKELPDSPQTSGSFQATSLEVKIGIPDPKLQVHEIGSDSTYGMSKLRTSWLPFRRPRGVFFYFNDSPHDGVLLTFKKHRGKWLVARMLWLVQ